MKTVRWLVVAASVFVTTVMVLGLSAISQCQGEEDYATVSRMTTLKERQEFFRSLTPERKSALWRKHYMTELAKHPELTSEQKSVVELAIVMTSPDLFTGKFPDVTGRGSVFGNALEKAFKDDNALRVEIFGVLGAPLPQRAERNQL